MSNESKSVAISDVSSLTPESFDKLFKSDHGMVGVQDKTTVKFPLELRIVQSSTGDDVFADPDSISKGDNGKLYVKPYRVKDDITGEWGYKNEEKIKSSDLKNAMGFTLLKVEFGVEILKVDKDDKNTFVKKMVVARKSGIVRKIQREQWEAKYKDQGFELKNQVRLVLAPHNYDETCELMEKQVNPFVQVVLSGGTGWDIWFAINKQMSELKKSLGLKQSLETILPSVWRIVFSSQQITSQAGAKFYAMKPDVMVNDLGEASKFEELVALFADNFTFFSNSQNSLVELLDFVAVVPEDNRVETETVDAEKVNDPAPTEPEVKTEPSKTEEPDPLDEDLPF